MKYTLQDRLLRRELGAFSKPRYSDIRGIYSDRSWINDLDIVNELGGHTGCVNALSWSTSGRLLASGSDDQHLNIHAYQPDSSVSPFALTTTVATGHTANIFSVKFMPHSDDRTLVTAAGDAEVRVFDIEHSGRTTEPSYESTITSSTRSMRFHNRHKGAKYLTDGNTNARVYRSHADRVKRIVTESSPYLFLTCSEDGEVRQFDLRLPSSAYPAPRGGRGFLAHRPEHDNSNVPPPLISYKRFNLDLNTISCSASRPHYIALGGAHLHCFLHDRRMTGRDIDEERGMPARASPASSMSSTENELMGQATRCVRKFAPKGQKKMRRIDNGHITACKISDANPNELIASWSGDHIYSFDLVQSPDVSEQDQRSRGSCVSGDGKGKARESGDRKRKRPKAGSGAQDSSRRSSRPRHTGSLGEETNDMALRVRYENGQTEEITMSEVTPNLPLSELESARRSVLTESQKRSMRIAKSLVKIRKMIFSLEASHNSAQDPFELASHRPSFTSALGFAASCLPDMDDISTSWTYPVNPIQEEVVLQSTLRANRDSSRRFVQAAGTLARVLGGRLQTAGSIPSPAADSFRDIAPASHEGQPQSSWEIFRYDFLRAILLWLEGGRSGLLQGFKLPPNQRRNNPRFPVPEDAGEEAIDGIIIPYLLRVAKDTDGSVPNIDKSRFERDTTRLIFSSEAAAVIAFAKAIKMSLEDLTRAVVPAEEGSADSSLPARQDRKTALKFWAFKVGRGLLMNAGEGVNFQFVDMAFGGLGQDQSDIERSQEDIDPDEDDDEEAATLINRVLRRSTTENVAGSTLKHAVQKNGQSTSDQEDSSDIDLEDATEMVLVDESDHGSPNNDLEDSFRESDDDEEGEEEGEEEEDEEHDDDDDDEDEDSDDEERGDSSSAGERSFMFRSATDRGKLRERVEQRVPCASHTRKYQGHCNVKTVKDANFFGLHDEYVVSGSDGGHLFIWDRRTSELVNILEGDNEVVNVIQGHPYEPMLAVSGIDNTVKIFSPDHHARENAEKGVQVNATAEDSLPGYALLPFPGRHETCENSSTPNENSGLKSRKRMHLEYQITSQNDVQRQGGMRDTFVTRGMLAQLTARLRARQGNGPDGGGGPGGVVVGEDGETIFLDDNCTVM